MISTCHGDGMSNVTTSYRGDIMKHYAQKSKKKVKRHSTCNAAHPQKMTRVWKSNLLKVIVMTILCLMVLWFLTRIHISRYENVSSEHLNRISSITQKSVNPNKKIHVLSTVIIKKPFLISFKLTRRSKSK